MQIKSFTLAEVLTTIGIIGIVAAMTLPSLMSKQRKVKITTSMKKFYSTFSQSVLRSQVANGDFNELPPPEIDHNAASLETWWKLYMQAYFIEQKTYTKNNWFIVDFADGSGAGIKSMSKTKISMQIVYCVNLRECLDKEFIVRPEAGSATTGRNSFVFLLDGGKLTVPSPEYTREQMLNNRRYGCSVESGDFAHRLCSTLIMHDGWEIKDDYPVKI